MINQVLWRHNMTSWHHDIKQLKFDNIDNIFELFDQKSMETKKNQLFSTSLSWDR